MARGQTIQHSFPKGAFQSNKYDEWLGVGAMRVEFFKPMRKLVKTRLFVKRLNIWSESYISVLGLACSGLEAIKSLHKHLTSLQTRLHN